MLRLHHGLYVFSLLLVWLSCSAGEPTWILSDIEQRPSIEAAESAQLEAILSELDQARAAQDRPAIVKLLYAAGALLYRKHDFAGAEAHFSEALSLIEAAPRGWKAQAALALDGLALVAAQREDHAVAASLWDRAIKTVQRHEGVLHLSQVHLLDRLARAQTALEQYDQAERTLQYMVRVEEHAYGKRDVRVLPAYTRLGEWYAYMGDLGAARLMLRRVLQIGESKLGADAAELVNPLRAFSRTYRVELVYGARIVGRYSDRELLSAQTRVSSRYPSSVPPEALLSARSGVAEGERAILRAVEIANSRQHSAENQTLLEAGDWFVLRGKPERANEYYVRAWLASASGSSVRQALESPEPIFIPTMRVKSPGDQPPRYASLQFVVKEDGTTEQCEIIEATASDEELAELQKAVRYSRYRPRFVDGKPIAQQMQYRHVFK